MKNRNFINKILPLIILLLSTTNSFSQDTTRQLPESWSKAIPQAAFRNRFEAMPDGKTDKKAWGTIGVKNRYIDNGTETKNISIWGGKILKGNDNLFHIFPSAWPENNPKGHMWWSHSDVLHCISTNLNGPYSIVDTTVIKGHSPEMYKTDNGTYVLYYQHDFKPEFRTAKSINSKKWDLANISFNTHGRIIGDGLTNGTFTRRQDGSYLMVSRGGEIFISKDGISDYHLITDMNVYPNRPGCFEDPVVWRDSIQYNLIVNDWFGRLAYYLRSGDGITWNENIGEAYSPGIAFHKNGTKEEWYKYERIKIFQDKYGRAVQANFAVIDIDKKQDLGNDNHSSKNICIPLNPGLLMEYISTSGKEISIRIKGENNFVPNKDIDLNTIKFGLPYFVDLNKGIKPKSVKKESNGELTLTFNKKDLLKNYTNPKLNHIYTTEKGNYFSYKLIATTKKNKILFGFLNIPEFNKTPSILIADKPTFTFGSSEKQKKACNISTTITNLGIEASKNSKLKLYVKENSKFKLLTSTNIIPLLPYDSVKINSNFKWNAILAKCYTFKIEIIEKGTQHKDFVFQLIPNSDNKITSSNPKQLVKLPEITLGKPTPGKIALESIPKYKNTKVHHAIYLPTNYSSKGHKFPIIIELTGNKWKDYSSGKVEDAHLGYSLTLGKDAVIISAPYISESGIENELTWWGNIDKTVDYLEKLVPFLAKNYNVDTSRILLCGFSRGAIGTSFIGLNNDKVSKLWSAFFTHDHFDGQKKWNGTTWGSNLGVYRNNARERIKRAKNRPWYISFNNEIIQYEKPISIMHGQNFADFYFAPVPIAKRFPQIPNQTFKNEHNDNWPAFDFPEANNARAWVKKVLKF